jgi:hypothetical protein
MQNSCENWRPESFSLASFSHMIAPSEMTISGILGKHYYAVVGMWLLMVGAIGLLVAGGKAVFGRSRFMIAFDVAASIWITLYASHLIGWAVYLHRDEL